MNYILTLSGASVVTLCELLDYIVMHCVAGFRRRKRTDNVDAFSSQTELQQNNDTTKKQPPPDFGNVYE